MALLLEIEFLTGVSFAARGPDTPTPDWPPQPDRIFSALVASWGARGEQETESLALQWLEKQDVPALAASAAESRMISVSYVPPNDSKTGRSGDRSVLPAYRRKQPRRFPASRPHNPVLLLHWQGAEPDEATLAALDRLAADTSYVGHSASMTRCRFLRCNELPGVEFRPALRRVYPGRFEELRRDYKRFLDSRGKTGRPRMGDPVIPRPDVVDRTPHSYFSNQWLLLEHTDGEMPDIRATALVAKELHDTILSGYRQCGMGDRIPVQVSGHTKDGRPAQVPHLAIAPLAFAGYPYADGHVLGFALVPPLGSGLLEQPEFLRAIRRVAPRFAEQERHHLRLRSFEIGFSLATTPSRRSMQPDEYTRPGITFATVTPIVLDRHLKKTGAARENEIVEQIRTACRNIGLPDPELVVPDKHSAIEGAPSAQPSGKSPAWMRWRLPDSLASRALTHAVIRFSTRVEGPVILGAGRFIGLGLCRPIDDGAER